MATLISLNIEKQDYELARKTALEGGSTLTKLLEDFVVRQAKIKTKVNDRHIHEADAEKELWCSSRSTLYTMRSKGELVENVHYVIREGLIFYKFKMLRDFFKKHYPHIEDANAKRAERKITDAVV